MVNCVCLPFTKRFRKIGLETKVNGTWQRTSEKVVLFFRTDYSIFDTSYRPLRSYLVNKYRDIYRSTKLQLTKATNMANNIGFRDFSLDLFSQFPVAWGISSYRTENIKNNQSFLYKGDYQFCSCSCFWEKLHLGEQQNKKIFAARKVVQVKNKNIVLEMKFWSYMQLALIIKRCTLRSHLLQKHLTPVLQVLLTQPNFYLRETILLNFKYPRDFLAGGRQIHGPCVVINFQSLHPQDWNLSKFPTTAPLSGGGGEGVGYWGKFSDPWNQPRENVIYKS